MNSLNKFKLFLLITIILSDKIKEIISEKDKNITRFIENAKILQDFSFDIKKNLKTPNCLANNCTYSCYNGFGSTLIDDIKEVPNKNCSEIKLKIFNYTFFGNKIPANCLQNLKPVQIKSFSIFSSNISTIETAAFSSHKCLEEILFENQEFLNVTNNIFDGLINLKKLSIIQYNKPINLFHNNVLKPIQNNLHELTIKVGMSSPSNLTNSDYLLRQLSRIDFSYNNFQDKILTNDFSKLSSVEMLNLSYSQITWLRYDTFQSMSKTLRFLDLSGNHLKIFSAKIFGWKISLYELKLKLNSNLWYCNCELENELRANIQYIVNWEELICEEPKYLQGSQLLKLKLCSTEEISKNPEYTKTNYDNDSVNTTTEAASTKKNFEIDKIMNIQCNSSQNNLKIIKVGIRQKDFYIKKLTYNSVQIIFSDLMLKEYILIWFNRVTRDFPKMEINYNEYGLGCLGNLTNNLITVNGLENNTGYIFCLATKGYPSIPPFNCLSHHTTLKVDLPMLCLIDSELWIPEDMKITGISVLIFGIFVSIFLGGSLVYCCIKRKPTLLKGHSKRVVGPEKSQSDIIVLPKGRSSIFASNDMLSTKFILSQRRHTTPMRKLSITSFDSTYVNPDLYEIIPPKNLYQQKSTIKKSPVKRNSNDPLPAIPVDINGGGKFLSNSLPNYSDRKYNNIYSKDICNV